MKSPTHTQHSSEAWHSVCDIPNNLKILKKKNDEDDIRSGLLVC